MVSSDSKNIVLSKLDNDLRLCRQCSDAGFEISPGAIFSHPTNSKVMLIGQAPGVTEVEAQRPFNAGSGRRLFQWLEQAGWPEDDFRKNNVMTAVTKCYPGKGKNGKGDRVPTKTEQKLCRLFLNQEILYYEPQLIILVGGLAIKLFYPATLRLDDIIGTATFLPEDKLSNLLNFNYTQAEQINEVSEISRRNGCWIVPLPHPSGASLWPNKSENKILISKAMDILSHLKEAYYF